MNFLDEAYKLLKEEKLIKGWTDMSERYCLKSPSYLRAQRAQKREISLAAMASLASRLQMTAQSLQQSKYGNIFGTAEKLIDLSDRMWSAIHQKSLQCQWNKRKDA